MFGKYGEVISDIGLNNFTGQPFIYVSFGWNRIYVLGLRGCHEISPGKHFLAEHIHCLAEHVLLCFPLLDFILQGPFP